MLRQTNIRPIYGKHYAPGYVGFTYKTGSLLSAGIAYFSHWDDLSEIPVSHCFTVESIDFGIETHIGTGVQRVELKTLFDDPSLMVMFRKPKNLMYDEAQQMLARLRREIGKRYDTSLTVSHMVTRLCLGGRIGRWVTSVLNKWLDSLDEWMCSELVSYGLLAVPRFRGLGVLAKPPRSITPQQLFADDNVFEAWKHKGGSK